MCVRVRNDPVTLRQGSLFECSSREEQADAALAVEHRKVLHIQPKLPEAASVSSDGPKNGPTINTPCCKSRKSCTKSYSIHCRDIHAGWLLGLADGWRMISRAGLHERFFGPTKQLHLGF